MCRRGRQFLLWLVLFVTAGFDPMLGLDEGKTNRVGRDRQTGMPSIISSTTDLFQAAWYICIILICHNFAFFKKKFFLFSSTEQQKVHELAMDLLYFLYR